MPPGILKSEYERFNSVLEVLTVTRTLVLVDEVYKKTLNLPMDSEVDYENSFDLFGKSITQGALANFYRNLEMKYPSLAEALVSEESLTFLGAIEYRKTTKLKPNSPTTNINMMSFFAISGIPTPDLQEALQSGGVQEYIDKNHTTLDILSDLNQSKTWVIDALRCYNIRQGIYNHYITVSQLTSLEEEQIASIKHQFEDIELKSKVNFYIEENDKKGQIDFKPGSAA
jgi:hypothetical protein